MKKTIYAALALALTVFCLMGCRNSSAPESSVLDNIMTRTSIRHFTDQALSEEQIETLLRAGMAAPTAMNLQPWSFVVVTDTAVRAKLVSSRVNRMYAEAPCLIVVCGDITTLRKPHGAPADAPAEERPNDNWSIDCSAATENILLAAHDMGLGAVWTACWPYPERYGVVKEVLGIPEKVMPLSVIPVGYPAENPEPKDKWKPEKIHYNQW